MKDDPAVGDPISVVLCPIFGKEREDGPLALPNGVIESVQSEPNRPAVFELEATIADDLVRQPPSLDLGDYQSETLLIPCLSCVTGIPNLT